MPCKFYGGLDSEDFSSIFVSNANNIPFEKSQLKFIRTPTNRTKLQECIINNAFIKNLLSECVQGQFPNKPWHLELMKERGTVKKKYWF